MNPRSLSFLFLQSIVPCAVSGAPSSFEPYTPSPGLPVGTHRYKSFYRLEIQSCNDGKASAVSSIPLALEACLMSSLLTIHSYARLLISANIAYFPIIPLCLPSSRPLKLLTLVSLLYSIFRILLDALYAAGPNTRKPTQPTISQLLATRNAIHNATKTFFFNVHRCSRSLSPHALL